MILCRFFRLLALAMAISTTGDARANPTYNYTGKPFTSIQDGDLGSSITASVTFNSVVGSGFTGTINYPDVFAWQISSGPYTLSSSSGVGVAAQLQFTLSAGSMVGWDFSASDNPVLITTLSESSDSNDQINYVIGFSTLSNYSQSPGTWVAVPEPSPWSMIAVGGVALLGIVALRRRRTAIR